MDNRVINSAIWLCRISLVLTFAVFLAALFVAIHLQINPAAYSDWYLVDPFKAGMADFKLTFDEEKGYVLKELSSAIVFWLLFRLTGFIVLIWLIFRQILGVLNALGNLNVFYAENIRRFKQIALFGIILAVWSSFNIGIDQEISTLSFTLPLGPVLFAVGSRVLAEIFEEGKRLHEDSNSII
jgi:hypothetical protein